MSENGNMAPPPNRAPKTSSASTSDRLMNDTTMPPPKSRYSDRKTAVNVKARGPHFSLNDWKRLLQSSNDLAQRKGQPLRRDIPKEEVMKHNKNHDGWIILRGKVYNIAPYLAYHPGGIGIFKSVLGKDATALFDKFHRWVNVDGLIGPLLLGTVATSPSSSSASQFTAVPPKEQHLTNAPRVSAQKIAHESSLLSSSQNDDDDSEEEPIILPKP
jgi:cytochrome b involved in lipid metabolism